MNTIFTKNDKKQQKRLISIPTDLVRLEGSLVIPERAQGLVVFAHASGISRHSPRNHYAAQILQQKGLATLLMDLLTAEEEDIDRRTRQIRFNIPLLSSRLITITDWLCCDPATQHLRLGYFGDTTGSAAAFVAATQRPEVIQAIVTKSARPDLVGDILNKVQAATLLIVGEHDFPTITLHEDALTMLNQVQTKQLAFIPKATHLLQESGALEEVTELAGEWFNQHLTLMHSSEMKGLKETGERRGQKTNSKEQRMAIHHV